MTLLIISLAIGGVMVGGGILLFRLARRVVVAEDSAAITVDRDGFIKRVLPAGRHILHPFEKVDFALETKPKLTMGQVPALVTEDGLAITVNWSGIYRLCPENVTDKLNQRLRGLANAEKAIARNVDIYLRKLGGDRPVQELFRPAVRDRIERQLNHIVADRVKPMGIELASLNLQALELPYEVAEALNKAKAIATLDGAIRHIDPTTREIVRGAYQLDEILHWDQYLPVPSRRTMHRLAQANG
jgi:regulator of protease activity HflC (stomatin/prohibitin superfamily)